MYIETPMCVSCKKTENEVVFRDPYAHVLSDPYSHKRLFNQLTEMLLQLVL